ncbi:MAG: hypothetical protein JWN73_4927 [Betaproteobacteria bacterium]|nr:hypothetical protein [Betaproteobacteria bacterium]
MPAEETPISPQDIYARTVEGNAAMDDAARPLSSGFREMLRAIDGKRTVEQLREKFPRLDEEDVAAWLGELLRAKLIDFAEVPFELPELKTAKPAAQPPKKAQSGKPASAPAAGAEADEFDVAAMAANVEQWLNQDTESFTKVAKADLSKTIQSAALQSTQALATLQDSGFFANLMQPLRPGGEPAPPQPQAARSPEARPPLRRKGLAIVFESDSADTAVLTRLLNAAGYQAQLCAARQQLVLLLNQPLAPEVIFLKLGAKDVDVFKVLEKLRMHPRLGKTPVVMMADAPSREDIAKSILLGASGWMAKPYTAQVVDAALSGILSFPQG